MLSGKTFPFKTLLRYFLLALFLLVAFPFVFYKQPESGLDPSWNIALHLAIKYDLIFGKDFVFTYGPLGFLCTRLPIAVPKIVYILFDLFFLFNFLFVLHELFKREIKVTTCLFLTATFVIVAYEATEQWYFFFYLFYLFNFLSNPSKFLYLIFASILAILCFYIKLSLGIIAIVIFLAAIAFMGFQKKITWKQSGLILIVFSVVLSISTYFLKVDFTSYVLTSLQIINAYNDAMYRVGEPEFIPFLYAGLIIVSCFLLLVAIRFAITLYQKKFIASLDEFFVYGIVALFIFILFKNGFVRTDGHNYYFFRGILFAVSLVYLFASSKGGKKWVAGFCWIVIVISLWAVNSLPGSFKPVTRLYTLSIFPIKLNEVKEYFINLERYQRDLDFTASFKNDSLKAAVGNATIDVIPAEISQVYFNDLHYNPRPVIQSYSAYNGFLDSLNSQKYESNDKPDYILFSLGSIDDRYPFFDETRTKMTILSNYQIETDIEDQTLLAKSENPRTLTKGRTESRYASLGKDILIPRTTSLQFTRIQVDYSFWGKLKRLFFRPPGLLITFTLSNGDTFTHRAVTTLLSGGVIINKFIDTNEEFRLLMLAGGTLNTNVKKILFSEANGTGGFKEKIKLITTHYSLNDDENASRGDSLKIQSLYSRFKPSLLDESLTKNDSIRLHIESLNTHSQFIQIAGWAFLEKRSKSSNRTSILLESDGHVYELPTESKSRPDLSLYFNREDLGSSGFSATGTRNVLPPGSYRIGVRIADSLGRTKAIAYSDREAVIPRIPQIEKIGKIQVKENPKEFMLSVDMINEDDEQVSLSGWAAIKDRDSKKLKTYVLLVSETETFRVSTEHTMRPDVASYLKDPQYLYSGYSVTFPKEKLPKGIYRIGLQGIVEKRQVLNSITEKVLRHNITKYHVPQKAEMPDLGDFPKSVDQAVDSADFYTISGWAAPVRSDFKGYTIQLILKSEGNVYACDTDSRIRKDVTVYFKNQYNLDDCGFAAKINKYILPKGKYEIGIYLHRPNEKGLVQFVGKSFTRE